jgi:Na+-translocating ferredoxin:NAD+ oxidoreductase RnfE subunit
MAEITHNKVEIAIEQLEIALDLFLSGKSYVSALTLAGAAEEIFGKATEIKGIKNSLQEQFEFYHQPGLEWINPRKSWREFTTFGKTKRETQ